MGPPGAELGDGGDDPVALGEVGRGGGEDLEDALISGGGRWFGSSNEGGEGWFGAIGALDGVDVCRVNGGGEGADED